MSKKSSPSEETTLTISPANVQTLHQLVQLLDFGEGLTIGFVRCNLPIQRRLLVEMLKVMIKPLDVRLVEVDLQESVDGLRERIKAQLEQPEADGDDRKPAVFVYGLEHSLPSGEDDYPLLGTLNMGRELFQRDVPCPLVIWLPDYALTIFARGAPDFWAWRSGVYEFGPEQELMGLVATEAVYDGIIATSSLSLDRKEERIRILERLLDDYRELGDGSRERTSQSHILHKLGMLHQELGDYGEARALYQESLKIHEQSGDESGIAKSLHQLGTLAQLVGDYREGRRLYRESLKIKEELGDKRAIAVTLHQLGRLAENTGDYQEADRLYQESLKIFEDLGNRGGTADTLHNLGNLAYLQGEYVRAHRLYQESLRRKQELGDHKGVAYTLGQLGNVCFAQGEYDRARQNYERVLDISQEQGDKTSVATALHQLGILRQLSGDYQEARRLYQESLKIREELGDKSGMAIAVHQLGMLAQATGDYREARRLYQQSLGSFRELEARREIASSLGQLGRLAQVEGRLEEAVRLWVGAAAIFQDLGSPDLQQALEDLERARGKLGDERFQELVKDAGLS